MTIPDEVWREANSEKNQTELAMDLALLGTSIKNTEEELTKLQIERDKLIYKLSETGMPASSIAGITGMNRHKISEIIKFVTFQRQINSKYMDDPPEWFGK